MDNSDIDGSVVARAYEFMSYIKINSTYDSFGIYHACSLVVVIDSHHAAYIPRALDRYMRAS